MKILYITPHLSTGGLPQYLLRKIEAIQKVSGIECLVVEYSDLGGDAFVVQKNKIKSIVPIKTLYGNKFELLNIINEYSPDVIHLEEIPEYFMDYALAKEIYNKNTTYKIIETTHDSSFDVSKKVFIPDEFLFVSNYSVKQFSTLGVPSKVVEYPIPIQTRPNRASLALYLGLDLNMIHILNVGLFTPRKNQKEIVEYAKQLVDYPVQFHFVGNQAGNFEFYWKPIMDELPRNCKIWGERDDVDMFYSSMDLFLFTSKGTDKDKETNPLSIKEALMWDMDIFIYNLPVYMGKYDYVENITYLSPSFEENLSMIKSFIQKKKIATQ